MKDITIKDVTKEELQYLYKKNNKDKSKNKSKKAGEIIKAVILLVSIVVISFLFLWILG